jgi:hypothetical protein
VLLGKRVVATYLGAAGECSAGAHAAQQDVDLAAGLVPDLRARGLPVCLRKLRYVLLEVPEGFEISYHHARRRCSSAIGTRSRRGCVRQATNTTVSVQPAGRLPVRLGVGGVLELLQDVGVGRVGCDLLGLRDGAIHACMK